MEWMKKEIERLKNILNRQRFGCNSSAKPPYVGSPHFSFSSPPAELMHTKPFAFFIGEKEYQLKMDRSYLARTLQLANLAPDIVKLIWENRQPETLTLDKLRKGIPESWVEQRKLFLS